jgi:hypothetical protein
VPEAPGERSHPHLPLLREDRSAERKKRRGHPGERPDRGGRAVFAPQLEEATTRIVEEQQAKRTPPSGIQPHLVFRVPFAEGASVDQLIEGLHKQAGLEIVSVEPDGAIIAFRDDVDLQEFNSAVKKYRDGPRVNSKTGMPYKSTTADFVEYIEPDGMRLLKPEDRIGDRLRELIGEDGAGIDPSRKYIVDLELWHPGGSEHASRALEEVTTLVQTDQVDGEKVLDTFRGQFTILAKVAVFGAKLEALLELAIVGEANLPPQPVFDPIQASRATRHDFPTPPQPPVDGPRLCVVDSGIASNHPLLASNVGH